MKMILRLLLPIIALVGVLKYRKFRHSRDLKFTVGNVSLDGKLKLSNLLNAITINVDLLAQNFSPSTFTVSQIQIDAFAPNSGQSDTPIAEVKSPLSKSIKIAPNTTTKFRLQYLVSAQKLDQLIASAGGAF